ncbi:hypothetical protein BP6252_12371 [Coleophoma cylindrospora]|uniref:Prion-inhibition and propagation HeLo domain-containing protein n=1 Tax=Coleophoma cylindrospora TaxID=1849047 RepID=A0A3D8QH21_9HELO|nr:hypothetical protein BP6252_12371 [Coleophoma cylindrospora]
MALTESQWLLVGLDFLASAAEQIYASRGSWAGRRNKEPEDAKGMRSRWFDQLAARVQMMVLSRSCGCGGGLDEEDIVDPASAIQLTQAIGQPLSRIEERQWEDIQGITNTAANTTIEERMSSVIPRQEVEVRTKPSPWWACGNLARRRKAAWELHEWRPTLAIASTDQRKGVAEGVETQFSKDEQVGPRAPGGTDGDRNRTRSRRKRKGRQRKGRRAAWARRLTTAVNLEKAADCNQSRVHSAWSGSWTSSPVFDVEIPHTALHI